MNTNPTVERLLYIALAAAFVGVLLGFFILYWQLRSTAQTTNQIKQNNDELTNHLNCIGLLLSQPNRGAIRIGDLQNCKLTSN